MCIQLEVAELFANPSQAKETTNSVESAYNVKTVYLLQALVNVSSGDNNIQ